jgi:two-component system cell cycle sensor histidine kinase PleC
VLYRYYIIEEVVLKQVSDTNAHFAEVYKARIWDNHKNAIAKLNDKNYRNLMTDEDFISYAKDSASLLTNTNSSVTLYNKEGRKILTNSGTNIVRIEKHKSLDYYGMILLNLDRYFLRGYISNKPITEAYKGKTSHSLISRSFVTDENENQFEKSFISSYIPIINFSDGNFTIEGVIEITTDITGQWKNITYLEKRIFLAFFLVFLIFFIIVIYNTSYAQRIINKQFETNRALEEAKIKAETDSSAKTEFLANISHELRTPLNAVIGFSEIIMAETYGPLGIQQYKDYVVDINSSGKHLLSVINDVLDFSKASAQKLQVDKVELNLNKIATTSMRFVKPRANEASIQLVEEIPTEQIIIIADPKRLKQALLNLLSNSVKFTPSGGKVTLSLTLYVVKRQVCIIVTDTGIGMSDQVIPKALSPFGQVDNKLNRKYTGTGLGLPLTKKLIELMGGKFNLESNRGKGTKVTIIFSYTDSLEL